MKSLLLTIALTLSFVAICACTFLGVRLGPALWRGAIVFVVGYGGGLLAALVVFVSYLSPSSQKTSPPVHTEPVEPEKQQTENKG